MTPDETMNHIPRKYSIFEIDEMRKKLSQIAQEESTDYRIDEKGGITCCIYPRKNCDDIERELRTLMMSGISLKEVEEKLQIEKDKNQNKKEQLLHDAPTNQI